MALTSTALPPMEKIYIIGIWVETVLYGINCVLYGLCMFVLLREGRVPTLRWVLLVVSTVLFLLCTTHVGASLRQLLDAFVYAPADVPDYSTTYWLDFTRTPRVLKDNLYVTVVLSQHIVLIWRLYIVFACNWRVTILPIILAAGCAGCAFAASDVLIVTKDELFEPVAIPLIISACAFGVSLNLSVMIMIVARFWWMSRTIAALTDSPAHRYTSSIYIVIESGVIYAVFGVILLVLFALDSPAALAGLDVISQLAALVPLSIFVKVGHIDKYRLSNGASSRMIFAPRDDRETFQVELPQEQDPRQDLSLHIIPSRSLTSLHDSHP